jgi:short-subunit dehydrogenase
MGVQLKKLKDQVIVVTGASSGIGLATARIAASRGAKVVLAARDRESLVAIVDEITARGGDATYVVADVSEFDDVRDIVDAAETEFDGFDTWINNAGLSIYGPTEEVPLSDARRLFDVNYWGMVNGSLAALPFLRARGGALINIGSVGSDMPLPLQGHYSASKHAVKGFTDSIRIEVEKDDAPVVVTLIKPSSIDTPFPEHARNYMDVRPKLPPPVYSPEVVAEAILFCAEHPRREVTVGGGARAMTAMSGPLADHYMKASMFRQQQSDEEETERPDSLYAPQGGGRTRGHHQGRVMTTSAYTAAAMRPMATVLGVLAAGTALTMASRAFTRNGAAKLRKRQARLKRPLPVSEG